MPRSWVLPSPSTPKQKTNRQRARAHISRHRPLALLCEVLFWLLFFWFVWGRTGLRGEACVCLLSPPAQFGFFRASLCGRWRSRAGRRPRGLSLCVGAGLPCTLKTPRTHGLLNPADAQWEICTLSFGDGCAMGLPTSKTRSDALEAALKASVRIRVSMQAMN